MGTGTCAVDGCTALEFRTTGRCLNHQDVAATPQPASSGPSAINFSNPGHEPQVSGAINFSETNQPSAASTANATVGVEGTQMEVRDAVRSIPGPPSPTPSLKSLGVIFGSPALWVILGGIPIMNHPEAAVLCCGGMLFGLVGLCIASWKSSSAQRQRRIAFQQVAIVVDGNDERCPSYPYANVTLLSVAGVLLIWVYGFGLVFFFCALMLDFDHKKKVKAFEAWARATYR